MVCIRTCVALNEVLILNWQAHCHWLTFMFLHFDSDYKCVWTVLFEGNLLIICCLSDVIWVMARQLNLQLLYHECFPNCQASLQINGIGEFSLFQPLYLYEEFIKSCTTKHCTTTEILIPSFVEKEIFSLRFSETSLHISNHTDLKSLIKDCWNISACSKQ